MYIRKAVTGDIKTVVGIYESAREFMHNSGNPNQWTGGYPAITDIKLDIENDSLYVCEDNGQILGVFCYFEGEDVTYLKIYDGKWLNNAPYGVVHRIAVAPSGHRRGVASFCFDYVFSKCGNLKIDTHRDNLPMQKVLQKNGFIRCGIIYLDNGDERIAYQKSK